MKDLVLGIETSCDDTSIALMDHNGIVKLVSFNQDEVLKTWKGVVPEISARAHLEKIPLTLKSIFQDHHPSQISRIGVTTHPGLLGPLITGLNAAKTLSLLFKKPIVPVNHLYAHLEAIHIDQNVPYPYLGLLFSGGHSLFLWVKNSQSFEVLGSTIDDAAGEAFDKGGKLLGLNYPAGRIIDEYSKWGNEQAYDFPIGLRSSKDCNLSYSGLKTSLRFFLENNSIPTPASTDFDPSCQAFYDVCASYQKAIVDAIILKTKYAIQKVNQESASRDFPIVCGGGVACNSQLRASLKASYSRVNFVTPQYCQDNGAMIANYAYRNPQLAIAYPECLELDSKGRFIRKADFRR